MIDRRWPRLSFLGLWLSLSLSAASPVIADSPCQGLLRDGLRDVVRSYSMEDIERVAYKKHCSKRDDKYSFSDDAEFFWFFGATASPNFDARMGEQWCKENASRLERTSTNFLEVLTFSNEALSAFNACMRQQKENVLTDAIVENDVLIVSVWRNTGRPSYLQKFDYDKSLLDCTATGAAEDGQPVGVELSRPIKLVDDNRLNIVCRRKLISDGPSVQDGVAAIRPRTTVALTTDLGTPLALTLDEEEYLASATVSKLESAIAALAESQAIMPWLPFDWNGTPKPIPQGWAVCDGSPQYGSRFPDLAGQFLMGSTKEAPEAPGKQGGYSGFDKRSAKYQGDPHRDYLRITNGKFDLRPPWYSVIWLCRVGRDRVE